MDDPLLFVRASFPWGKGVLSDFTGPDLWQRDVLAGIRDAIAIGTSRSDAMRYAVASGHGVGKSALVAWIILWAMLAPDTRGVVTANTEHQLRGKTWAELAKWHRLCSFRSLWDCTATALISRMPGHDKTWRVDQVPWSERNTEAFAGLHNKGKRVLLVFDEASAIPDVIWEVSEGALTDADTQILWCAFGNPTRNTGRFRECFGRYSHRWNGRRVDSRNAAMTNKAMIEQWAQDYGDDSDFFRVRVKGEFPRAGTSQFISSELAAAARGRHCREDAFAQAPKVMALDVARFGEDSSVITKRQGIFCHHQIVHRDMDLMTLSGIVAKEYHTYKPDALFVDGVGIGAGVVDRLRQLGVAVVDAQAGERALNPTKFANRRAEMWDAMREWLSSGCIPDDSALCDDLTGVEYGFNARDALQLEKKEDMKKRGLASPDRADSLAMTFYAPVHIIGNAPARAKTDYDVFGYR